MARQLGHSSSIAQGLFTKGRQGQESKERWGGTLPWPQLGTFTPGLEGQDSQQLPAPGHRGLGGKNCLEGAVTFCRGRWPLPMAPQ